MEWTGARALPTPRPWPERALARPGPSYVDAGSIPAASTSMLRDSGRLADRRLGATQARLIYQAGRKAGSVRFEA